MMKYYVAADTHAFFTPMRKALEEKGFFSDIEPHKLIICGDLFDRGGEVFELQQFIIDLIAKDEVILIKGNHEDLFEDLLFDAAKWVNDNAIYTHHWHNGTIQTALMLADMSLDEAIDNIEKFVSRAKSSPLYSTIIPLMHDYYEINNYIFVHGWIPAYIDYENSKVGAKSYLFNSDWRNASYSQWREARWINGMVAAKQGVIVPDKKIVCGHYHCSYGWSHIKQKRKEFPDKSRKNWRKSFEPFVDNGIIAIDACTAYSGIVNCIILEDEEVNL